jgi:hypothetical protein
MTRREVLKRGAVDAAGLAVLPTVLAACGSASATPGATAAVASTPGATSATTVPPTPEPLGVIEDTRVVFYKTELSVINDSGVLLNLIAKDGPVGIRFFKDFGTDEDAKLTNMWHMGYIEGKPKGYEGLAILRDWLFTAALWDADGKLTVGRLDPHPPANPPAGARFHVRGTLDEIQARVDGVTGQDAEIFEVGSANGLDATSDATPRLAVRGDGATVLGSPDAPTALVLHDTATGQPYAITVENGRLVATRVGG